MKLEDAVAVGHNALASGRWVRARAAFSRVVESQPDNGEALFGLGQANWWLGEVAASIELCRRAYSSFRRAGQATQAAEAALHLCLSYGANYGNHAAALGWIGRAEGVVADEPGPLQGWLWLTRGYVLSDPRQSLEFADRALALARQTEDFDLELQAISLRGRQLVRLGSSSEGLPLIDEAMAGSLGGEAVRLDTVVFVSCEMLIACEQAPDFDRARRWCELVDEFTERVACPYLYATCRALFGGVLVISGRWPEAERELTTAMAMARPHTPPMYAYALGRMAELRLRQGRPEEARRLLRGRVLERLPPLLAAELYLATGKPEVAAALLERHLRFETVPPLARAALIAALVRADLAAGKAPLSSVASQELRQLLEGSVDPQVSAYAATIRALIARSEGDLAGSARAFEEAWRLFAELEWPFEAARSQLELARSLAALEPELAIEECKEAVAVLRALGAAGELDDAYALLRSLGAGGRTGTPGEGELTMREQEVLALIGEGLSNPEIARRLIISRKTAAHHVSNVLMKLGVRNRAEAAVIAATRRE